MKYISIAVLGVYLIFVGFSITYAQDTATVRVESSIDTGQPDMGVTILETVEDIGSTEDGSDRTLYIPQYNETDLEFIRERGSNTTDDHKGEIDILSTPITPTFGGKVEYTWKIEEGQKAVPGEEDEDTEDTVHLNKSDLTKRITTDSDGGLRTWYAKYDSIEGESDDAQAGKPKEIVVVGSKVRGDTVPRVILPENNPLYSPDVFFDIYVGIDIDEEDLGLYAVGLAQSDENIEGIVIKEKELYLSYKTEIELFGFIPVQTTQRTTVTFGDGERGLLGRVEVSMPWWHVLGRKTVKPQDIQMDIEQTLASLMILESDQATTEDQPTEHISFNFTKVQAQTLQTVSNVSKVRHDIAMSVIRNIK